ncbi:MAG: hypothetical protein AB9891_01390 [Anaerolineaceae bacterium]
MLLLVERIGSGRGFTIAQLSLVIGALISIFWLKDPPPQTMAALLTFLGCLLAMIGGIVLGNIKYKYKNFTMMLILSLRVSEKQSLFRTNRRVYWLNISGLKI